MKWTDCNVSYSKMNGQGGEDNRRQEWRKSMIGTMSKVMWATFLHNDEHRMAIKTYSKIHTKWEKGLIYLLGSENKYMSTISCILLMTMHFQLTNFNCKILKINQTMW